MSRTGTILETSQSAQPIPATMRAAVYRGKGRMVVEDVPVPRIAEGEVLIRVAACGICGTDIKAIEKARVAHGQAVLIMGQGPIGLLLMLLSKLAGAFVIGSDPMPERRAKSLSLGADLALDPRTARIADEIRSRTDGRGADVVLVAVPMPSALTDALAIARPGGRILLFAQNDPEMRIEFPAAPVGVEEKEILGTYSAPVVVQEKAARLIFSRQLAVRELISHRFSLEAMNQALELAAHPISDSLKVVIQP